MNDAAVRWVLSDRPEEGLEDVRGALRAWGRPYDLQVWWGRNAEALMHIYSGRLAEAQGILVDNERQLARSSARAILTARVTAHLLCARVGLAACAAGDRSSSRIGEIRSSLRRARRVGVPWFEGPTLLAEAGLAAAQGSDTQARAMLRRAVDVCERSELLGYLAFARVRLGKLLGGEEGRALGEPGRSFLRDEGVVSVDKFVAAHAPGFRD